MESMPQEPTSSDYAAIFKVRRSHKINRQTRDLSRLDEQTANFLQMDQQQLQAEQEQARQNSQNSMARKFTSRLIRHYIVDDFFFSLAQTGHSTQMQTITPDEIEAFLNRERLLRCYKGKPTIDSLTGYPEAKRVEKMELNEFFIRAIQAKWMEFNPVEPLVRKPSRLVPQQPSLQTQADIKAFLDYLEDRVAYNRLSPTTRDNFSRTFRTLLYDAEVEHRLDPTWPTDLDGLFSQPRWVYDWLRKSKNRSVSSRSDTLARGTILRRLNAIRHVYLFLKRQGRVAEPYYKELLGLFTFEDGSKFIPGARDWRFIGGGRAAGL